MRLPPTTWPSSARTGIAFLLLLAFLTTASRSGRDQQEWVRVGTALNGGNHSAGTVGFAHASVGDVFWYALPLPTNMSDRDVEIVDAEVSDVPPGVEVLGYGAYDLEDTEGIPLLATEKDPNSPKFRELRDYSAGFEVKAKSVSDFVYMAQLRITGKVRKNSTECRYEYRQDGKLYSQSLRCSFELRLKK